jgi:hypothetical protein
MGQRIHDKTDLDKLRATDPEHRYQDNTQADDQQRRPNAVTELIGEFVSMMSFFETANVSSPFHEFMHHVLNSTDENVKKDMHERFAKGFEVYDRLLATPEEIDEEFRRRTTVEDMAAMDANVDEALERARAEEQAIREQEQAWGEFDESYLFEDLNAIALEDVDGYFAYLEDIAAQRDMWNEKKKVLD